MKSTVKRFHARSGIGLVEVALSATILLVLAASLVEAVSHVSSLGKSGSVDGRLQVDAQDAIARITADLKASGFVHANGRDYPYLFENGVIDGDHPEFAPHAHAPAIEHASSGDADYGPDREMVFVRPRFAEVAQTADGQNYPLTDEFGAPLAIPGGVIVVRRYDFPVIDTDGLAGFQTQELSYVVVTASDGVNELQRRTNGGSPTVVARGVERLVFDTGETDPIGVPPTGVVRVRLWLRSRDGDGTLHRHFAETLVRLQNGG
jgi:hypothetical protein